jgi:hypothetical protein
MWRTTKKHPMVGLQGHSIIAPVLGGGGPVMVREGATVMFRSAPLVAANSLVATPVVVPPAQAAPMLDLDFDVSCLRATRS